MAPTAGLVRQYRMLRPGQSAGPRERRPSIIAPITVQATPSRAEIIPKIVNARRNVSTIKIAPTPIRKPGMGVTVRRIFRMARLSESGIPDQRVWDLVRSQNQTVCNIQTFGSQYSPVPPLTWRGASPKGKV